MKSISDAIREFGVVSTDPDVLDHLCSDEMQGATIVPVFRSTLVSELHLYMGDRDDTYLATIDEEGVTFGRYFRKDGFAESPDLTVDTGQITVGEMMTLADSMGLRPLPNEFRARRKVRRRP